MSYFYKGVDLIKSGFIPNADNPYYSNYSFPTYYDDLAFRYLTTDSSSSSLLNSDGTYRLFSSWIDANVNGNVNAMVFDASFGNLYIGGNFTTVGPDQITVTNIARFNTNTGEWSRPNVSNITGEVYALEFDQNINLYVGGAITTLNVNIAINGLIRLNVSPSVVGNVGNTILVGRTLNGSKNGVYASTSGTTPGIVLALKFDAIRKIMYVGGKFGRVAVYSTAADQPAVNIVCVDTNTVTNNFITNPTSLSVGLTSITTDMVYSITLDPSGSDPSGNFYIGGSFTKVGDVSANNIACYSASAKTWSALGGGVTGVSNVVVRALAVDALRNLYVGGNFTTAGASVSVKNIAKYNIVSTIWYDVIGGFNSTVKSMKFDSVGDLYLAGTFTTANSNSVAANGVVKYTSSKSSPTCEVIGTSTNNGITITSPNTVNALEIDSFGNLYVGGKFTQAGGTVTVNNMAKWNNLSKYTSVSILTAYSINNYGSFFYFDNSNLWSVVGTSSSNGVPVSVFALQVDSLGNLYVGGTFTTAGDVSANNIAKYNIASNNWSALGSGTNNGLKNSINGSVYIYSLVLDSLGNLYVGGTFNIAGDVSANNIAKYNIVSNTWSQLGKGVTGGDFTWVSSLVFDSLGNLYVGGIFTTAGDVSANNIAKYNIASNTWSALGSGSINGVTDATNYFSGSSVSSMVFDLSGNLYVGGKFKKAGSLTANCIAIWNRNSAWEVITVKTIPGIDIKSSVNEVRSLVLDSSGNIYVGGNFSAVGEHTPFNIAKYNVTQKSWSILGSSETDNGVSSTSASLTFVNSMALDSSGNLYVGGAFDYAVPSASNYVNSIAKYTISSSAWSKITRANSSNYGITGTDPAVYAMAVDSLGTIYVGGTFNSIAGVNVNNLAKYIIVK